MSGVKIWILVAMEAQHVEDLQFYIVEDLKLCSTVDYQPSLEIFHVEASRIMRLMRESNPHLVSIAKASSDERVGAI